MHQIASIVNFRGQVFKKRQFFFILIVFLEHTVKPCSSEFKNVKNNIFLTALLCVNLPAPFL